MTLCMQVGARHKEGQEMLMLSDQCHHLHWPGGEGLCRAASGGGPWAVTSRLSSRKVTALPEAGASTMGGWN